MATSINQALSPGRFHRVAIFSPLKPIFATQKAQAYTMLILSLFSLAFFAFFAINPTITTIAQLRKRVEDAGQVDKKLQAKITNLSQLQKAYPTIQADIPTVFDALPQQGRPANLLGKIKAMANRSSITISSLQIQQVPLSSDPNNTDKATPFFFVITGTGSYPDILAFLNSMIGFDRVVSVDNFTITRAVKKGEGKQLTILIRGTAYVLFEKR